MAETIETNRDGLSVILTNDSPSRAVQPLQRLHWFFTWNNYEDIDIETLETLFNHLCHKYCFQEEIGENGTHHIQGVISLKKRMRWTEFGLPRQIHWEKPWNLSECYKYCCKLYSRKEGCVPKTLNYNVPQELNIINKLRPWQTEMYNLLCNNANDRTVFWLWESNGNVGKSAFAKYICHHLDATYIDEGKKADIINIVYKMKEINERSIIVIDVPRNNGNKISYKAIEQIKNGMICNTKYETGMRLFNSPHIIVFSNYFPDKTKLSNDRWKIGHIHNNNILWEKEDTSSDDFSSITL